MIKVKGTFSGRPVLVFGLSHENLDQLRREGLDGGIKISAQDMSIPFDIFITAAPTEQDMMQAFAGGIGPETVLPVDKRLKS